MTAIKVRRSDAAVKAILAATFPAYRGRTIHVEPQRYALDVRTNADGGTFSSFAMLELATLRSQPVPLNGEYWDTTTPAYPGVRIPIGYAVVERTHFCGADLGVTIHVHPDQMPRMLA